MNILQRWYSIAFFALLCIIGNAHSAETWERTGTFDGELSGGVISLGKASNGHLFACANTGAPTYRSIDNGATWVRSSLPSNNYLNAFAAKDSIILGASQKGMYRSVNHGGAWKLSNSGLTSLNVRSVQFAINGAVFAGTHDGGVFRSLDSGLTWQAVNTGLAILKISALAVLDSTSLLAATDGEGVFLSTNSGSSWTLITSDVRLNSVRSLAVTSGGTILAGTDQYGIFRNATRGDAWDYLSTDITSSVNALLCKGNEIYAATGLNGVYYSKNNGDTWTLENTGIAGNVSYCFTVNALGQVLVGANGGAVYRRVAVNSVSNDANAVQQSIDRILYTNSELRLTCTLPIASRVTFAIYSILGEKIAGFETLMSEPGTRDIRIEGKYTNGSYICQMEAAGRLTTQLFQIQ